MALIKKLEIKKLLKELDFIESDYIYKNELINEADTEFLNAVNNFLIEHPKLKEIFDKKISKKIDDLISNQIESSPIEERDDEDLSENKDPKLRKLFRKIAKATHPDMSKDSYLNSLYVKSKSLYENDDLSGIYLICDELNIEFNIEEIDTNSIFEKIEEFKKKIEFLESTVTWNWYNETNDLIKNKLLLQYISRRLND